MTRGWIQIAVDKTFCLFSHVSASLVGHEFLCI